MLLPEKKNEHNNIFGIPLPFQSDPQLTKCSINFGTVIYQNLKKNLVNSQNRTIIIIQSINIKTTHTSKNNPIFTYSRWENFALGFT